jgi:hypothetical protein
VFGSAATARFQPAHQSTVLPLDLLVGGQRLFQNALGVRNPTTPSLFRKISKLDLYVYLSSPDGGLLCGEADLWA